MEVEVEKYDFYKGQVPYTQLKFGTVYFELPCSVLLYLGNQSFIDK